MRCKMSLKSITREAGHVTKMVDGAPVKNPHGGFQTEPGEQWTVVFYPVYQNGENIENSLFWAYTPSGELKLTLVNKHVVEHLVLGNEYLVDITPAQREG